MTREEQRARKAQQARMRAVEQKHKAAARGEMDLPFLILTLLLTAVGLIMLFSASFPRAYYETGDGTYFFKRQALFAAVGLVAMFIVSKINYQRWRGAGRLLVGLALFLLILVIIPHNPLAITANRATRWLGIRGVFQFQPSEIAKLAVIVYFSDTISKKREKMLTWRQGILPYVALLAVIGVLMMLEPHFSGTILIFATGAVLMIVGGIQGWLVAAGVGGVGALGFLFVKLAESGIIRYGAARIEMWHNPWEDYYGDGYQLAQSLITIGSGGLLGVGLGRGRQKFLYLPEQYNDFIFSVVAEESGFAGSTLAILLLAGVVIFGCVLTAQLAADKFGQFLCIGIAAILMTHTFINIGMTVGVMPITGVPLPMMSYGGTFVLTCCILLGLVQSVYRHRRIYS